MPEELADRIVPSDPRISPDGSKVVFVAAPIGQVGEKGGARCGSRAMDYRPVNSRPEKPTIPIPAGHPMARGLSSARTGSSREATSTGFSCCPSPVARACHWANSEASCRNRPGRQMVAGSLFCAKTPNLKRSAARKKERDDAIVVEEDPRFTRLWVVDVDSERARCLTTGEREVRFFAWTPDSRSLVAITTDAPEYDARFGPGDLWQISVEGACRGTSRGSAHSVITRHRRER